MGTRLVRGALPVLLMLLLLATVAAEAGPAAAATVCASTDGPTAQFSSGALAGSAFCLVNQERTSRGLTPLRANRHLIRAASGHARDMVMQGYFSHDSVGGRTFVDRIRKAGYLTARALPALGEDLGWGSGELGTPREIVEAWMESPDHRKNILDQKFHEAGMGVAFGDSGADDDGVTYALDFGSSGRR
jgi:uncharacterized protein YkwD